jgi:hypothetical protein
LEILASPAVGRGSVLEDAFDSMHISNDSGFHRAATDRGSISEIFKRVDDLMARLNAIVAPEEVKRLFMFLHLTIYRRMSLFGNMTFNFKLYVNY